MSDVTMEKIVSLAKRRGFIFQGSEIYGGLAGTWDYGPMGVALKNNINRMIGFQAFDWNTPHTFFADGNGYHIIFLTIERADHHRATF